MKRGMLIVLLVAIASCTQQRPAKEEPVTMDLLTSLMATDWEVQVGGSAPPATGLRPTVTFKPGSISGFGGCNQYSAAWLGANSRFNIEGVRSTRMACEPDAMKQEELFFKALTEGAGIRRLPNGLMVIVAEGGEELLRLRPLDNEL